MNVRTEWKDYFSGISPSNTFVPKEYTTRQNPSDQSVYVFNCLFNKCTSTSSGGAVYCTSVSYLLIESSSFFSCRTNDYGGAVCNNAGIDCIFHKVCGYDCSSTGSGSYGQFTYKYVNNVASNRNYINYSSIARCVNEYSSSNDISRVRHGKICCPSVNISMNKCGYCSGIYLYPFCDSSSVTCSLTYSSFTDNNALSYTCIYFDSSSSNYEIKSCNILRNTQVNRGTQGTIHTYGKLMIKDSCILENNANYIFYSPSSSYTITISNCTTGSTSNNGCLTIKNAVTKSFILALNHMSTQNCNSEYDSAGALTPIIPPSKEKIIRCYTGNKIHYRAGVSDLFSLFCVFKVSFIHTEW
jgi:predicted outer membrane repeat protein